MRRHSSRPDAPLRERKGLLAWVAAVVTVILAIFALYQWCYLPYECNQFKRAAEQTLLRGETLEAPLTRAMIARANFQQAQVWIARCPTDLDLYMIAGASLRQLGQSRDAIPYYEKALRLDRRPELYLNLGQAQVEANQPADAVPNLAAAVAFNPELISEVPGAQQEEVRNSLRSRPNVLRPR